MSLSKLDTKKLRDSQLFVRDWRLISRLQIHAGICLNWAEYDRFRWGRVIRSSASLSFFFFFFFFKNSRFDSLVINTFARKLSRCTFKPGSSNLFRFFLFGNINFVSKTVKVLNWSELQYLQSFVVNSARDSLLTFSPLWTTRMWYCKWLLTANFRPQVSHSNGFSPVCTFKTPEIKRRQLKVFNAD